MDRWVSMGQAANWDTSLSSSNESRTMSETREVRDSRCGTVDMITCRPWGCARVAPHSISAVRSTHIRASEWYLHVMAIIRAVRWVESPCVAAIGPLTWVFLTPLPCSPALQKQCAFEYAAPRATESPLLTQVPYSLFKI